MAKLTPIAELTPEQELGFFRQLRERVREETAPTIAAIRADVTRRNAENQARIAAEQEAERRKKRNKTLLIVGGVVLVAGLITAVVIAKRRKGKK